MISDIFQWLGFATGVLGALFLALNNQYSRWGFIFFLISNIFWLAYGFLTNAPGLIAMQIAFSITSFIGIFRSFQYKSTKNLPNNKNKLLLQNSINIICAKRNRGV